MEYETSYYYLYELKLKLAVTPKEKKMFQYLMNRVDFLIFQYLHKINNSS